MTLLKLWQLSEDKIYTKFFKGKSVTNTDLQGFVNLAGLNFSGNISAWAGRKLTVASVLSNLYICIFFTATL